MEIVRCTTKELRKLNASDLKHEDVVVAGKYYIHIRYGTYEEPKKYKRPLCSYVELENGNRLGCTLGTPRGIPYFIDDFLGR